MEGPDGPVPLGGQSQRRVLAALLARPDRVVSRQTLAGAVWPEVAPADERQGVQTVVSRLRRALGPHRTDVVTADDGYRLAADEDNCDLVRFDRLVERAASAPAGRALELLDEALSLWEGPAFGSLAELDAVRLEAVRLDEQRLVTAEDRFQLLLDLGRPQEAVPGLESLVASEPLRERARAQLMQALHRTGRQPDALRTFADYRDLLGEDLGLEPSPAIRRLEEAILLDQAPEPVPAPPGGPALSPAAPPAARPGIDPALLEDEGWDAMWRFDHDAARAAREGAYVQRVRAGDRPGAARVAIWLGVGAAIRLRTAVAFGWFGRARGLLEGQPAGPAHGLLTALTAMLEILGGHLEEAVAHARAARAIGGDSGDADVEVLGKAFEGWALVRLGRSRAGLALLDEAMASAVAGELGRYATGLVYCRTLCACLDLMDFERATEWTTEIERLRGTGGPGDLPGDCRTHRAAVHLFRGELRSAEAEARVACSETAAFDRTHQAQAEASMGEIALRRGDLDAAEGHFVRAQELSGSPMPGLALLRLRRGDGEGAARAMADALADAEGDPLVRARLLPVAVEIDLARGEVDGAAAAAAELVETAAVFPTSALRAEAAQARGSVELAGGSASAARRHLRAARQRWLEAGSPYRAAVAGVLLAEALARSGREDEAGVAARAAAGVLDGLGAGPDHERAAALVGQFAAGPPPEAGP